MRYTADIYTVSWKYVANRMRILFYTLRYLTYSRSWLRVRFHILSRILARIIARVSRLYRRSPLWVFRTYTFLAPSAFLKPFKMLNESISERKINCRGWWPYCTSLTHLRVQKETNEVCQLSFPMFTFDETWALPFAASQRRCIHPWPN